jgi:hypothetical protein
VRDKRQVSAVVLFALLAVAGGAMTLVRPARVDRAAEKKRTDSSRATGPRMASASKAQSSTSESSASRGAAASIRPLPPLPASGDTLASFPGRVETAQSRKVHERFLQQMEETKVGPAPQEGEGDWSQGDGFENWFYQMRAYPIGSILPGARARALEQAKVANDGLKGAPGDSFVPPPPAPQMTWVPLGPSKIPAGQTDTSVGPANPVSGRLTAIAVHPTNANIAYAGGAQGGVWKTTNATSGTPTWIPITDHQASLAIGAIAIDPVNPNIIYVGTGEPNSSCDSYYGQGILRSADGGFSWTLLSGGGGSPFNNPGPFVGKTISKILIDPVTAGSTNSTTIWAGTTSGVTSNGTAAACSGVSGSTGGVWKSIDSGATWTLNPAGTGTQPVRDMALDPTNHDILYAAVQASGVWKSTNAAIGSPSTYTKLAGGFPNSATVSPAWGRISIATGGAAAHNTIYASISSAGSNLWGIYKSVDAGATWAHMDNGFNGTCTVSGTAVTRTTGPSFVTSGAWNGRRMVFANNNSTTIASVTDASHLVLTATPGALAPPTPYSVGTYPQYCNGQCFYDMTLAVDPSDATGGTIYVGGNPQSFSADLSGVAGTHTNWRSDDGGNTWTSISQGSGASGGLHSDDHVYAFDTTSGVFPRPVYDGNDGGIWWSADKGASWTTMNTNIAITQFSGVSTHPSNTGLVLGGTQDNGTNLLNSSLQPPPSWFHSDFGDGGQSLIDQGNPLRMLHTYFNQTNSLLGPAKVTNGGVSGPGSWGFVGAYGYPNYFNGMTPTDPVAFYAPIAQHPAFSPNVIYFGTNKVYRSPDPQPPCCPTVATSGCGFPGPIVCTTPNSWTAKSPVLTKGGGAFLSWISVFPTLIAGEEVLYTGASDGRVEVSSNVDGTGSSPTWTVIDKAPLPNRAVGYMLVSPNDATGNTAYVGFSGFNTATPSTPGHVFKTTNGLGGSGTTWTDVSGDLPDIPVTAIAVEPASPERIYVGTDIGVFRSLNGGAHWSYLSEGFPVVAVFGLERNASTGQMVASTHGRGMFQLNSNDFTPPLCGGSVTGPNRFDGTASDEAINDTGVASIALQPGSTNLVISSITYLSPTSATYVVNTINPCQPGSGTVVVTDYNGNTCTTPVSLTGNAAPSAAITSPPSVRSASSGNSASVPDAGVGASYTWTIGGGAITGGAGTRTISFSALFAGSVRLNVTVMNSNGCSSTSAKALPVVVGDFDGDGKTDILWRHTSGANLLWLMNGTTYSSSVSLPFVPSSWNIVGTADFNGDGSTDILWQHSSGLVLIWLMSGTTVSSSVNLPSVDPSWQIVATGDFDGDGRPDILWRHTSGANLLWLMNGTTVSSSVSLPFVDPSWSIVGTGDFNGDGFTDIVWRHTSGANLIWLMNGTTYSSSVSLPFVDTSWSLVATGDFSIDGKADIFWRHTSGVNLLWLMNGTTFSSNVLLPTVDPSWSVRGPK